LSSCDSNRFRRIFKKRARPGPFYPESTALCFYEADFVKTRGENCFLFIFSSF